MPRLVGKQSNSGLLTGVVLVAAVAVAAGGVEYFGYTNFIPGWGSDQKTISKSLQPAMATFNAVKAPQS
jgi:hypothetical protein